ncbi:hypothetical protein [Parenemella sanctibonifatiensis]|nr:hypothetical protein [Parenemella sanctibonifatiensis]
MSDDLPPDMPGPLPPPDGAPLAQPYPLDQDDPVRVGDFWVDARLTATPAGVAYLAHEDESEHPAMVILLSMGAAASASARDRFAGAVNELHIDTVIARGGDGQDEGRLAHKFRGEEDNPVEPGDDPEAPWVALEWNGSQTAVDEADRLLHRVDLGTLRPVGTPAGPDFQLPWVTSAGPGRARVWPLPWPGRHDRAGGISVLASWLVVIFIAALALMIVLMVLQQPTIPPPSPTDPPPSDSTSSPTSPPPSGSPQSPESGSPSSPESGSPSPESGSPSPESGSPSPESGSPSPETGSPSGGGPPTGPNPRL